MSIPGKWLRHGLLLVPLAFLAIFFFYPLAKILWLSLAPEGTLSLGSFSEVLTSSYYRDTLVFTLFQAVLSTLLTLAVALPSAYVFVRFQFPGKNLLLALAILPFVLPTVVVAAAFTTLIGPQGLLNQGLMSLFSLDQPPIHLERTLAIILIAHVFYNYPLALRMITGFWANQNPRMEEAARVLGCRGWRLWWHIRLPVLRPILLAAASLVFIFTFTSFGVILILGGPTFATIEVEIYRQTISFFDLPIAATLSLAQIVTMFGLMAVYTRFQNQIAQEPTRATQVARKPSRPRDRLAIAANLGLLIGLLFLPLLALVIRSVTLGDEGFTLRYYQLLTTNARDSILFVAPIEAVGNSLVFALMTTILALSLGILVATYLADRTTRLARWLDPLFMLPLATSAVTLGLGFIIALDRPPLNLRASPLLIPLAHTLVALPFVVRNLLPALRGIPSQTRESARVLGAPPWQVWRRIDLPLISRGLVVGATFAFTVSMGEFGASVFVARPDVPTMPVAIFRLLGRPGSANYGEALAMSVILMAVCAASFIVIERLRSASAGEF